MTAGIRICYLILVIMLTLPLSACDGDSRYKDLQEYIKHLKEADSAKKNVNVLANLKLPVPVTYQASNMRSPFEETMTTSTIKKGSSPLQSYPLTMLRFVGTVTRSNVVFAFILAPDNMVYEVKQGDIIGDNYGKVISINMDKMNIMEQSSENGKKEVQRVITLQPKE